MKKISASAFLLLLYCFCSVVRAQEGTWQVVKTVNNVPDCSECGMAAVNGKLYLIGNDGGAATPVKCLDPGSLTWTKLAEAPVIMHHFQPVSFNNKVYVLDAFSDGGFPDQIPMSDVYSYDTKLNTWEKGGEIPADRRRAGAGAAEYKGKLYLVAGIKHGHSSGTNNLFDCYDPETKNWTIMPDAPHIRDHCFATVIKDKLYVVGGRNTSFRDPDNKVQFFAKTVLDVDVYDFSSGKWSTLSAKLPMGSGGGNLVNLNNVLYYMGGERATETERNAPRKNTYYYDPSASKLWSETDSLHFARNGMAAAVLNNKIYAAGGSGGGPGGPPPGNPNGPNPQGAPGMPSQANRPPARPESNHPVDLEIFNLK
jgi:N-acetylneuraminic acid mutarotase